MEEKTYIIDCKDGTRKRVTVPASWKVTFGPAAAGVNASTERGRLQMPMALRFYESDKQQRAIFTDVVSFRDSSIKMEEEKFKVQEKDGYMECEGVRKRTTFQAKVREWINPDEEVAVPKLPSDSSIFDHELDELP